MDKRLTATEIKEEVSLLIPKQFGKVWSIFKKVWWVPAGLGIIYAVIHYVPACPPH